MEKLPEEMDSQEQREAALSIAEHFDTLAEFAHETRTFGKLGGGQLVEIYREAHGLDPRNGDEPKPPIRTFDKTADIVCPECSQHFADPETFELHHSFDVPFGPGRVQCSARKPRSHRRFQRDADVEMRMSCSLAVYTAMEQVPGIGAHSPTLGTARRKEG